MPLARWRDPFDDDRRLFELKYGGFRALAYVLGGKPKLVSRTGRPTTALMISATSSSWK
jgi:ATP-dependent DNA ligase